METAPLKSFATWARTSLIREVNARIAAVLAPASSERVERQGAVAALERAVTEAGGGAAGRAAVADKVAYTWFNRLIALRFMDANGYTGIGVVSPPRGSADGQPEILAEAKRGNFDSDVVGRQALDTVTGLLNGTRRSADAQGEAYALLLAEYCRYWNGAMPFMFEREGDYTELLIPADLLAQVSVLARAVVVLTPEVCKDVEVIGWLYQFYISERKDEVFAGFKKNRKAGAAEIPAATQLFTPHWIVRYLLENSLGRLWMLNRPTSRLAERMDYYIAPVDDEADYIKVASPEELKIIDPACGSGHMLTYAFDLLYSIYEEEGYAPSDIPRSILEYNLYGTEIDPRAGALAAFALTMKARSRQRTFFDRRVEPNICVLEPVSFISTELDILTSSGHGMSKSRAFWHQFSSSELFGALVNPLHTRSDIIRWRSEVDRMAGSDLLSNDFKSRAHRVLDQVEYLVSRYHVLVTNPPYMGSRNMSAELVAYLKAQYPGYHKDLFAAFVARAVAFVLPNGIIGMMSPNVWLYISSHLAIRKLVRSDAMLRTLIELPLSGFRGATVQICAFVLTRSAKAGRAHFVRLVEEPGDETRLSSALRDSVANGVADARVTLVDPSKFAELPNSALSYWLSTALLQAFERGRPLSDVGEPRQGLATTDNGRFVRLWHELDVESIGWGMTKGESLKSSLRWFPYNKGGDFRKWFGNQEFVVDWQDDGREIKANIVRKYPYLNGNPDYVAKNTAYYFLPSVSWSKIGTGFPAFRYFPQGFVFDVAGTSIFGSERQLLQLLAICNSLVARQMLAATSPTLNLEVGTLAQLPVVEISESALESVRELIQIHRDDWNDRETSWDFRTLNFLERPFASLSQALDDAMVRGRATTDRVQALEFAMNLEIAKAYGLEFEVVAEAPLSRVTLNGNPVFRYGEGKADDEYRRLNASERVNDLVSYAVGCMFGRYSLDEPGLILANQGDSVQDYLATVPFPSFNPDKDNVIPIVDGDWFEDDIVGRFREFLRITFGERELAENLRFVTASLGVKALRDYFLKSFYKDHVQRYKKRPIYWLFSSSKGSFNALIYMHRYSPSTVSTVLNEYLREYNAKLEASRQHHERLASAGATPRERAAAQKEADRLRKVLLELDEYEHDVLYPLATRQIRIDLDDGVRANYPKFGAALKKIPGLEAGDE